MTADVFELFELLNRSPRYVVEEGEVHVRGFLFTTLPLQDSLPEMDSLGIFLILTLVPTGFSFSVKWLVLFYKAFFMV